MKKIFSILVVFFLSAFILNAQSFEGTVDFKSTTAAGDTGSFKYFGKGSKIKMQMMSTEMGSVIFDGDKTIILLPSQKSYMEFSSDMLKQFGGMDQSEEAQDDYSLPTKTNETKTILGYECTKWTYKDGNNETELWITDKLGSYIIPSNPLMPAQGWENMFDGKPFFPLMIVSKEGGVETDRMEVTKIDKKNINDSEFLPPSDYKKMDLGNMMGQ